MSHRPGNKDCPLHPDGPKIISFDKPECTCKPTAADRLAEIRARHNATIFIDWGYDRASQPQSLSNAEQCHADRAELLTMIDARDKELEQVKAECGRWQARLEVSRKAHHRTLKELEQVKASLAEYMNRENEPLQGSNKE